MIAFITKSPRKTALKKRKFLYGELKNIFQRLWASRWLTLSVLALISGLVQLIFFVLSYSITGIWDIDWVFGTVLAYTISLALSLKVIHDKNLEVRRSQEQLIQSEKLSAIGQLVSGVAHEINNPLAGIMGYAGLILEDKGLKEETRKDVENVLTHTRRARNIVDNLLAFARPGQGKRERVDLEGVIKRAMELEAHEIKARGIKARIEVGDDIGPVMGDPSQLQQVILNLVLNARQAMEGKAGGGIHIRAMPVDGGRTIRLEVMDEGPGIPQRELGRVFEPFFTRKEGGTGLGLSVTYGIVKAHNGNIYAENMAGGGARFVVELPAAK